MSFPPETIDVRDAHRFDPEPLRRYLAPRLEGLGDDLTVRQFRGGQSNPTFALLSGGRCWVLRKKPPGTLLPSAHQIDREYRIQSVLAETGVPVPKMHLYCEDASIVGTPFYVMDHVGGRVFRNPMMPDSNPAERREVFLEMAATLAKIHRVDWRGLGLSDFGKPERYMERQVARWSKQYEASRTDDMPTMTRLMKWLSDNPPPTHETTLAHGDFRLENTVVHDTEPRILAVLDWELATLGHPLADLGYNCMPYHLPGVGSASIGRGIAGIDLAELGIPTEEEYVAAYCKAVGRSEIRDFHYYVVFAMFRGAAILQGVYKRGLDGNASSEAAVTLKPAVDLLAASACEILAGQRK